MADELLAAWVLVDNAPQADAVVRGCLHALVDEFLARLVVVKVGHHVQQSVNEYHRRAVEIDGFQRHAPPHFCRRDDVSVHLLFWHLSQHDHDKVLPWLVDGSSAHGHHTVLHRDGVSFFHLGVDVEHARTWVVVAQLVSQPSELSTQYRGHELRYGHRLAVARLPGDGVDASEGRELHALP